MFEVIFSTLAAIVTIFIAGLLIRKQNRCQEMREELEKQVSDGMESIVLQVAVLTNEEPAEHNLTYLENRMEKLNACLRLAHNHNYGKPDKRRKDNAKRKKYAAND